MAKSDLIQQPDRSQNGASPDEGRYFGAQNQHLQTIHWLLLPSHQCENAFVRIFVSIYPISGTLKPVHSNKLMDSQTLGQMCWQKSREKSTSAKNWPVIPRSSPAKLIANTRLEIAGNYRNGLPRDPAITVP
jgi:hypothetical protein